MKLINLFLLFSFLTLVVSCKKDIARAAPNTSLTIINASFNNQSINASISDTIVPFYINQAPIYYQSFNEYGVPFGNVPLILVSATDTSSPLLQATFNLQAGAVYSLYITDNPKGIDTVFMQDNITNYSDSLAGLRFINLAWGSMPISVNLAGNLPSQTEFVNLSYKTISRFKTYPDTNGISNYNFEIRDQMSGNLLSTFSWNFTLFKNNTLVLTGSEDPSSSDPISVFQVNNY